MREEFLVERERVVAVATVLQHLSRFGSFRRAVITSSWTTSGQQCGTMVCMFGRTVHWPAFGQRYVCRGQQVTPAYEENR
jgi:hypothetical protein